MRKLLSLMVLLVAAVLQVSAAQVVASTTLPDGGRPEHLYTMVSGNGYYANALTAPTQTAENYGLFAFYEASEQAGAYYIYSYNAAKWLSYDVSASYTNRTGFLKLTDQKSEGCYFRLNNYSADLWEIQPYTSSGSAAAKYLNWYMGIGANNPLDGNVTLGLWEDNGSKDGGSRWTLSEVVVRTYEYTLTIPDGVTVTIDGREYRNGETCKSDGSLKKTDVKVPEREGMFAVVSVDDAAQTIVVAYAEVPQQPEADVYQLPVLYPAQQTAVGSAVLTQEGDAYTLSNRVLAASFVKVGGALFFAGSKAMNLEPGTEPFTVAFGSGVNVPASSMTMTGLETLDLEGDANAVGGAEHFAGKALVAHYEYAYEGARIAIVWKAVLRDGSHYLRTEMELTGTDDVDMYNVIPMIYNVDTKAAGSAPAVVGNTRGAVLLSNSIFAGLENPTGYNSVGEVTDTENLWEQTSTQSVDLTAASWQQLAESEVPGRVTEATGAGYPNVLAYKVENVVLKEGQKVEVTVKYTGGNHRLNFGGADLLEASGDVASSDYHSGYSGNAQSNNSFVFYAPYDGTFTVRVMVENATESVDASSTLTLNVYTMAEGATVNTDVVAMQGLWSRNTTLAAGETWKISSVVGLLAQDGNEAETNIQRTQKRRSFLAYSERERAVPWRANPVYISWYELNIDRNNSADPTQNMNADQVLNVMNHWKTDFYDRYGVAPNSFVIDDGWDNYGTWTFHDGFPNEMRDMAALAEEMGAGVGAWLGPVGGYGTSGNYRRNYWTNKGGMVLSNPDYYATFKAAAENLTKNQGDFRFFKFDGISDLFSATGPKAGDQGNEDAEGIIRLERYVREELKRDIFFNTTVGTWASPFWYHYTDATWRQEADYGTAGNNSIDRENWITYRDRLVYQNYVTNSPVCPINTLMTHGFILTSFGDVSKNMSYDACRRELRCAFACGSGMVELYNDYALMNSINGGKLWADLAECIQWQKRNADVLPDIHWVGGNPWNGSTTSVYGWAAWNGTKATLTLRNGGNNSKSYTFTLREALNIPANVSGRMVLRKSFGEQDVLAGLEEGVAIDIDATLTVTLPGSSVFCFDGVDASQTVVSVTDITLIPETEKAEVEVGKTMVVRAETAPADATFPALVWSSADETVATVSAGLVKGLKAGTVTITVMATDGSEVSETLEVKVVESTEPEPVVEDYAVNFDKDADAVRADRFLSGVSLTVNGEDMQSVSISSRKPYVDLSDDENAVFTCLTGSVLTPTFDYNGLWMHGYVYIDVDQDKQFSFFEGNTDQTGSELFTFSFYSGDFNNDSAGVNSLGASISGDARNVLNPPSFSAPGVAGEYRIRFKVDWNSVDAGGQKAADGTCTGKNGILANGGVIVDATLRVTGDNVGIDNAVAETSESVCYDLAGRRVLQPANHGVYVQKGRKVMK